MLELVEEQSLPPENPVRQTPELVLGLTPSNQCTILKIELWDLSEKAYGRVKTWLWA